MKNIVRTLPTFLVLCVLVYLNYVTFKAQYQGEHIFPWDFLGGYHFQSFGWYTQGSLFSPPAWFPWSSIGYPSALAIQGGGWYLPLGILGYLDILYTLRTAAVVQALHVLLGAAGCYVLLRRMGFIWALCLIGAVGYHFSAAFYSNQQHIDIVRAYAIFPWLLWTLHPGTLKRFTLAPVVAALVLFQFLVSAYPGNIVTAVYACAVYFFLLWLEQEKGQLRRRYFWMVAMVTAAGAALAMLKWLPFFAASPLLETAVTIEASPFSPDYFLTLGLRYHKEWFAADVTMRSLYLPMAAWAGIFFIRRIDISVKLGLVFTLLTVVCGSLLTTLNPMDRLLPGLNISRFPLSDWRMVLHIGLIMLGCAGWRSLLEGEFTFLGAVLRTAVAGVLAWGAAFFALRLGYSAQDLMRVVPYLVVVLAIAMALPWAIKRFKAVATPISLAAGLAIAFVPLMANDGWEYHRSQAAPWSGEWSDQAEIQYFGGTIRQLHAEGQNVLLAQRPPRFVLGDNPSHIVKQRTGLQYNRCWYAHTYCLLGYDNIRLSRPHNAIQDGLLNVETGEALLSYLRKPSHLLLTQDLDTPAEPPAFQMLLDPEGGGAQWSSDIPGVEVGYVQYAPDTVQYRVSTPLPLRVTENEMWWPGWRYQACSYTPSANSSQEDCMAAADTGHTPHYLRTWTLPAGHWTVTLSYSQAGVAASRGVAALGMALLAVYVVLAWRARRRTGDERPGFSPATAE